MQFLLLEGIHENAIADLAADGYSNVVRLPGALDEDELIHRLCGIERAAWLKAGELSPGDAHRLGLLCQSLTSVPL